MSGEAFTIVPNEVVTVEPQYNNVSSITESMKKEHFGVSGNSVDRYQLLFKVRNDTERDAILTHYKDQKSNLFSFPWQSVPSYIGSGANITGRWVPGSLQMPTNSNKWRVSLDFEKDN
jgi:hypothetical protein